MLLELINKYYDTLNENDIHVLNYVVHHLDVCIDKTVNEIAKLCNVSASTIIRTTQKLGFKGYSEFKYFLGHEVLRTERDKNTTLEHFENSILLKDATETIKLFEQNNHLPNIYQKILESRRVFAYGTGHSQNLMLQEFARCLLNNNIFLNIIPSRTELELVIQNLQSDDLLLVVSLSGDIGTIKSQLQTLVVKKVPIISVTLLSHNELASMANYNLYYQVTSLNTVNKLNNSSFFTLNLVLSLLYEGLTNTVLKKTS